MIYLQKLNIRILYIPYISHIYPIYSQKNLRLMGYPTKYPRSRSRFPHAQATSACRSGASDLGDQQGFFLEIPWTDDDKKCGDHYHIYIYLYIIDIYIYISYHIISIISYLSYLSWSLDNFHVLIIITSWSLSDQQIIVQAPGRSSFCLFGGDLAKMMDLWISKWVVDIKWMRYEENSSW